MSVRAITSSYSSFQLDHIIFRRQMKIHIEENEQIEIQQEQQWGDSEEAVALAAQYETVQELQAHQDRIFAEETQFDIALRQTVSDAKGYSTCFKLSGRASGVGLPLS